MKKTLIDDRLYINCETYAPFCIDILLLHLAVYVLLSMYGMLLFSITLSLICPSFLYLQNIIYTPLPLSHQFLFFGQSLTNFLITEYIIHCSLTKISHQVTNKIFMGKQNDGGISVSSRKERTRYIG